MEDIIRLFRKQLFDSFYEWIDKNREALGEKSYTFLFKQGKEAENTADSGLGVIAVALWMHSMTAECGVQCGLAPNDVKLHAINEDLDRKSTLRLLHMQAACLSLQNLPKDVLKSEIPIISTKKFSLKLWVKNR